MEIPAAKTLTCKDASISTGATILGVKDDMFAEAYAAGKFEVAAIDYTALAPNALSVLAPFAKGYTGNASIEPQGDTFTVALHKSGYDSEAFNAKIATAFTQGSNLKDRAITLHEAEEILMEDLPIIPIIFNKSITMQSKDLSRVEYSYYGNAIFTKTKLKNYEDYIPEED